MHKSILNSQRMIVEQKISFQSFWWISMLNAELQRDRRWCKRAACSSTERRKLFVGLTQFLCEWRASPCVEQILGKRIETSRLSIVVSFIAFTANAENEFKKFPFLPFSLNKQFINASCVCISCQVSKLSLFFIKTLWRWKRKHHGYRFVKQVSASVLASIRILWNLIQTLIRLCHLCTICHSMESKLNHLPLPRSLFCRLDRRRTDWDVYSHSNDNNSISIWRHRLKPD